MNDDLPLALLLSPVLPLPGGSGRALRAWGWLQELRQNYRVQVLLPISPAEMPKLAADYPAEAVLAIGQAIAPACRWQQVLGLLLPWLVPYSRRWGLGWRCPRSRASLVAATASLDGQPVRRIVVFRLYLHELALTLAPRFPEATLELDLDDLESRTRLSVAGALLRLGRYRQALVKVATALQYALVERWMPGNYQTAYLAAKEDCRRLSTSMARTVAWRPNRVSMPLDYSPIPWTDEIRLLFVGTLNYPPNEEAVRDGLLRLVPELQRSGRAWRWCIVGRHASPELIDLLQATPQVELLPAVEDLTACYAAAQIVLVPLRAGGGTKLKTLEGLAYRRPLVSTRHGVRGLGMVPGKHYLPAESPQEFAAAIMRLAEDHELAEVIAQAGWQFCCQEFRQP